MTYLNKFSSLFRNVFLSMEKNFPYSAFVEFQHCPRKVGKVNQEANVYVYVCVYDVYVLYFI